ncbi:MAG: GIY-YIG nuclease family protein [Cyclobacteriaceae bacterium]|nr:GIY-YIG nuclease family protein [Cyclobacteriaceae bacterium]
MAKGGCIYMMANNRNTTIYTGVTSDLYSRVVEHREKKYDNSFTARYNLTKLVYYETFHSIEEAIDREKQIKGGSRADKEKLIRTINPHWKDLFDEISRW